MRLDDQSLAVIKPTLNTLFSKCVLYMKDENPVRAGRALEVNSQRECECVSECENVCEHVCKYVCECEIPISMKCLDALYLVSLPFQTAIFELWI